MDEFINNTEYDFVEIAEKYRIYTFVRNGKEHKVKLNNPRKLFVSKSGGHRIFTDDGASHYIPAGWIHLYWKSMEGKSHFSY